MKLKITENTPVSEIVIHYPQTRKQLEEWGIDYCCGGRRPFKEACIIANQSWQQVCEKLNEMIEQSTQAPYAKNWTAVSLTELADHIIDAHHTYLRENLPRLKQLAEKVYHAHQERHGKMIVKLRDLLQTLSGEIETHLAKEEQVLFPLIQQMVVFERDPKTRPSIHCGTIENPIRQMSVEHDSAGDILTQIRKTTSDYKLPADACESFKALYDGLRELEYDLHDHIHLENNILFPKAIQLENKICSLH